MSKALIGSFCLICDLCGEEIPVQIWGRLKGKKLRLKPDLTESYSHAWGHEEAAGE